MTIDERVFSSGQLQRSASLTYRQINDWDERGVLPHGRRSSRGWRKFSAREVFALMVVSALHRRFGIPVSRLRFISGFMMSESRDYLRGSIDLIKIYEADVWLLTDLENSFMINAETVFQTLPRPHPLFWGLASDGVLGLKINPIVKELLASLDLESFAGNDIGRDVVERLRAQVSVQSEAEQLVLDAIRDGNHTRIEVALADGAIRVIRKNRNLSTESDLTSLILEHPYQKLTVHRTDGKIVSVEQQTTLKPNVAQGNPE